MRLQTMKVLYVITKSSLGGAQTHVLDLVRHAVERTDVGLVSRADGPLLDAASKLGARTWAMPSMVQRIDPARDVLAIRDLCKIIKEFHPDIVHAHSSKAGVIARAAAAVTRVPAVFTAHGWAFTEGAPELRRRIAMVTERAAAKLSEKILCVSDYDLDLALRHNVADTDKMCTIHNGIPDLPMQTDYPDRKPVCCVMVARFAAPKEQESLVRALVGLEAPVRLTLVGDGRNMRAVQDLVRSLEVEDRVTFLGQRTDVPEILADNDIFALISNYEGFPYVTLEAMRAGLPVIVSNVGGSKEAVEDGVTGYLVPKGDVEAIQNRLRTLVLDRELRVRMGRAGRRLFLDRFTANVALRKVFSIYEGIANNSSQEVKPERLAA
jgi:glycosyltransferase involved in cell wall biosynthesis